MNPQRIVPNIWCNGNAEEAGAFYASVFSASVFSASVFSGAVLNGAVQPGATSRVASRYPETGLLDFQRDLAGLPLTVEVRVGDFELVLINAGDEFRPNPSISFMLNFDPLLFGGDEGLARAELGAIWRALGEGGHELMPLGEYPFSKRYGWLADRYGVNWQLMLTDPAGEPRPFVIPALMFDGAAQNRAAEAADAYTRLFAESPGGAETGHRSPYGVATGKASAKALAFGEFRIGDQWFMAADNGSGVDYGFDCGVSLEVRCSDQAEIDRLWEALSAVAPAEQCGWLEDRFGVSWQIVPESIGELMERPGAFERLMEMKKIVIADL